MTNVTHYPTDPAKLWRIFYDFTQIPRPSKAEDKIQRYIISKAQHKELDYKQDSTGNIVIYVPGTLGREKEPGLIIQNHVDMVIDKEQGVEFDFYKDPLKLVIKDGWLKAVGTTLGADNGIGCAAALALIEESSISHPPLELLFTTDEETGLNGAQGLDASMLTAKRMLNLDTEEWGSLYIGCAGGINYELNRQFDLSDGPMSKSFRLQVKGLNGGHSGMDIIHGRGNAIKVLGSLLSKLKHVELQEFRGGAAHNIIPREAFAILKSEDDKENIERVVATYKESLLSYLPAEDHGLEITLETCNSPACGSLSSLDTRSFLRALTLFPHGVHGMETRDIVSCSNNMARALLVNGEAYIMSSLRFFDREEVKRVEEQLQALARTFEFELKHNSEYPSWKPSLDSTILGQLKSCFFEIYGKDPEVTAIHAGLECGILKNKMGKDVDVCSFGPTIEGAHSPQERVHIESVKEFWGLLVAVLKKI